MLLRLLTVAAAAIIVLCATFIIVYDYTINERMAAMGYRAVVVPGRHDVFWVRPDPRCAKTDDLDQEF